MTTTARAAARPRSRFALDNSVRALCVWVVGDVVEPNQGGAASQTTAAVKRSAYERSHMRESLSLAAITIHLLASSVFAADPSRGEAVVKRWCADCHVVAVGQKNLDGSTAIFRHSEAS